MLAQTRPLIHTNGVHKFGFNPDVDAFTGADEDVIAVGGSQFWPAAAVAAADIDIVSSDVNDTAAGTGARSVHIYGLDANFNQQSEIVALSGTTDVHPTLDYMRIFRAHVETCGSGLTNAGNITIDDGAGGVLAYIAAGAGQTQQATYTIPADYDAGGYLLKWYVGLAAKTGAYIIVHLDVREYGKAWLNKEVVSVVTGQNFEYCFPLPRLYPPKADIRIRVVDASADNLPVNGGFDLMLA